MTCILVLTVMAVWGASGIALGYMLGSGLPDDDLMCGCDGEGMAHIAGSKGFDCYDMCGDPQEKEEGK